MTTQTVDLKPFNTFGISAKAAKFARFSSIQELKDQLNNLNNQELLLLGGGSNVLFTKDFNGLVLRNEIKGFEITSEDSTSVIVKSGAGEVWHEFVLNCIDKSHYNNKTHSRTW
jgi:UDP-N-acetylmuramate dehydrogenase